MIFGSPNIYLGARTNFILLNKLTLRDELEGESG